MREALVLLVGLLASFGVTVGIVRFDVGRLTPQKLARAWPEASLWSAAAAFGPLCLPIHFVKTRRSLVGLLLGVGWFLIALVALEILGSVADFGLRLLGL